MGSILGQGTKIAQAVWHGQKKKRQNSEDGIKKVSGEVLLEAGKSLLSPARSPQALDITVPIL